MVLRRAICEQRKERTGSTLFGETARDSAQRYYLYTDDWRVAATTAYFFFGVLLSPNPVQISHEAEVGGATLLRSDDDVGRTAFL